MLASIFPLEYLSIGKHISTYASDFHMPPLRLIPSCFEVQFICVCKLNAIMQISSGYDLHSLSLMILQKRAGYEC